MYLHFGSSVKESCPRGLQGCRLVTLRERCLRDLKFFSNYCLLHGDSDSFEDLKRVALKFEVQQRVWSEGVGGKLSSFQNPKGKGKGRKEPRARSQPERLKERRPLRIRYATTATKRGFAWDCWASKGDKDAKDPSDGGKAKGKASPSLRVDEG